MSDPALAPLAAAPVQSTTDQVFEALYAAVISLRLPPGAKLSEAEIAKQLDVSRQPVRDAFFRLSKLGFLLIRPQRATRVTRISERGVLDAAFVRTAIEVECLRLATGRAAPADLTRLREILELQAAALEDADPGLFHRRDDAFHLALCEIAGHGHAWDLIQDQKAHMDRVRYLSLSGTRRRQVLAEHAAIVDAVAAGDAAAAERRLRHHLGDIGNVLRRIRAAHAAYFEDDAG